MNFFRDRELALRFKNRTVPSRERFWYFFLSMLVFSLLTTSIVVKNLYQNINGWDFLCDIAGVIGVIFGTIVCYRTNRRGDDKEFIERVVSIGFPVLVQSIILTVGLTFLYLFVGSMNEDKSTIYDLKVVIFTSIYFYWRLNYAIKIASSGVKNLENSSYA
jgi:hypothetical protein